MSGVVVVRWRVASNSDGKSGAALYKAKNVIKMREYARLEV